MKRLKARKLVLQLKKEENRVNEGLRRQERAYLREAFERGISGQLTSQIENNNNQAEDAYAPSGRNEATDRGFAGARGSGVNTAYQT